MTIPDPRPDIQIRTLLSSWKRRRGFRSVIEHRKSPVPHASKTDLNREFMEIRYGAGWLFIPLMFFAAVDYLYLRIGFG